MINVILSNISNLKNNLYLIIIGAVLLTVLVILIMCFIKKLKKKKQINNSKLEINDSVVNNIEVKKDEIIDNKNNESIKSLGKFEIELKFDGFYFYLIANNGQLLFESTSFTTAIGASNGIKTFIKTVESEPFYVDEDKFGRFKFIINKRYIGENYDSKSACESSIESVKNFCKTAVILSYHYNKDAEKIYAKYKSNKITTNINWEEIERQETNIKPSGKYEIDNRIDGYHFSLIANNGQLLYDSTGYANLSNVKEAIKSFKKAVYVGIFNLDEDKFGRFRYKLRGSGYLVNYVGESYTTKVSCESSIESVKNFSKSAVLVPYKMKQEEQSI